MLHSTSAKTLRLLGIAEIILAKSFLFCWREVILLSKQQFSAFLGSFVMIAFAIC